MVCEEGTCKTVQQPTPDLYEALAKAQGELTNPATSATNPFFKSKYAPLDVILNLVRPILAKHGLCIIQDTGSVETTQLNEDNLEVKVLQVFVQTRICHSSGQELVSEKLFMTPTKPGPQGLGSAITYARRYQITSFLNIAGEDDDDGNVAQGGVEEPTPKRRRSRRKSPPKSKAVKKTEPPKGKSKKSDDSGKTKEATPEDIPVDWEFIAEESKSVKQVVEGAVHDKLALNTRNILSVALSQYEGKQLSKEEYNKIRKTAGVKPVE